MRIAIVVRSLKYGGMERAACNQADAFFQAGHNVDLIYFSKKNEAIAPREKGVNIHLLDLKKELKSSLKGILWDLLARFINIFLRRTYSLTKGIFQSNIFKKKISSMESKEKFDLILIRGEGTFEQIWKYKDHRTVKICVNVSTKNESTYLESLISKCYFENVNVNCNSVGGKEYYIEKLKRENVNPLSIKAIRNPFFKDKIVALSKEKNDKIPDTPFILGVGRLAMGKNFNLLLETYILLKEKFDFKYKLVLVGDGSEKDNLMNKCKEYNLQDDVIFAGYQENPYNWMATSEALVLTSKFDRLCGVLIEAMSCKTRIVAVHSPGGVKELMQGEKLSDNLVKPEVDVLSQKILETLNNDKSLYYKDYDRILSSLFPSNIVNEWISTYVHK